MLFFDRLYELFCDQKKHLMSNIGQSRDFFFSLMQLYDTLHPNLYVEVYLIPDKCLFTVLRGNINCWQVLHSFIDKYYKEMTNRYCLFFPSELVCLAFLYQKVVDSVPLSDLSTFSK